MDRKVHIIYGVALLAAAGTGVMFVGPGLPTDDSAEHTRQTDCSQIEQERQLSTIQNHTAAQARLLQSVIAGHLTVRQAAEHLRDLHTVDPYFNWQAFRDAYSGGTDQERCCSQLLALVRLKLSREPRRSAVVLARLNRELESCLQSGQNREVKRQTF